MTTKPHRATTLDRLVADLAPVRARRAWHDAMLLAGVMVAELLLIAGLAPPRDDLGVAVTGPMFWWKLLGSAGIAVAAAAALVVLVLPSARRGAGRHWTMLAVVFVVLGGAALWFGGAMPVEIARTLDWREGLMCVAVVEAYALPVWLTGVAVARRGAPAHPRAAAVAAGLLGAAWGAAGFAWSCPHDDPLYVVTWYGLALLIGAGVGSLSTGRLRW